MRRKAILLLLAAACGAVEIQQYHSHDFAYTGAVAGNPFDVEMEGIFQGPEGVQLRVPGFYDGAGRWKIRFSPTRVGAWSLRTVASVPALDGKIEEITCVANGHPQIHGGLRVDAAHPYHFIYEDGTRYFLLGYEADWLWALDLKEAQRPTLHRLIGMMAARGFNHVLVNVYAHDTAWSPGRAHEWDYGPPAMFAWEGTNEQPDHSRLNPAFFQKYDEMMQALREKGIVAHIMLKVYNKRVNWPPRGSADEERYFRYVVARYQAFSNVVWDFSKESYNEKDNQLQKRLIDLVRRTDVYGRLTTAHDDEAYEWDPELNGNLDFRTDQQHTDWAAMVALDRAFRRRPVVNSEFGYERGVDPLPSYRVQHDWEEQLRRAYLVYLAGGYGVYYYHNTAWDVVKPDPEPPGMKRFQWLKEALSAVPYWKMEPSDHLAAGGPCLALEGDVYAFYVEGARITVNLMGLEGAGSVEWIDTWTGARQSDQVRGPAVRRLDKPEAFGKAPALLVVKRAQ